MLFVTRSRRIIVALPTIIVPMKEAILHLNSFLSSSSIASTTNDYSRDVSRILSRSTSSDLLSTLKQQRCDYMRSFVLCSRASRSLFQSGCAGVGGTGLWREPRCHPQGRRSPPRSVRKDASAVAVCPRGASVCLGTVWSGRGVRRAPRRARTVLGSSNAAMRTCLRTSSTPLLGPRVERSAGRRAPPASRRATDEDSTAETLRSPLETSLGRNVDSASRTPSGSQRSRADCKKHRLQDDTQQRALSLSLLPLTTVFGSRVRANDLSYECDLTHRVEEICEQVNFCTLRFWEI